MSGSLLGRGRGGRLVVYGGCPVLIFILVFLYHAATSEMDRLRELQEQCVHQQEALAAQLQGGWWWFEYNDMCDRLKYRQGWNPHSY